MPEQPGEVEILPCGCKMYTVGEAFVFEPHAMDCEFYLYVLSYAQEKNKPVTKLDLS
jgi:hypothetical protein